MPSPWRALDWILRIGPKAADIIIIIDYWHNYNGLQAIRSSIYYNGAEILQLTELTEGGPIVRQLAAPRSGSGDGGGHKVVNWRRSPVSLGASRLSRQRRRYLANDV